MQDIKRNIPLIYLVIRGFIQFDEKRVISKLIKFWIDINVVNNVCDTALVIAGSYRDLFSFKTLLKSNTNVLAKN